MKDSHLLRHKSTNAAICPLCCVWQLSHGSNYPDTFWQSVSQTISGECFSSPLYEPAADRFRIDLHHMLRGHLKTGSDAVVSALSKDRQIGRKHTRRHSRYFTEIHFEHPKMLWTQSTMTHFTSVFKSWCEKEANPEGRIPLPSTLKRYFNCNTSNFHS